MRKGATTTRAIESKTKLIVALRNEKGSYNKKEMLKRI